MLPLTCNRLGELLAADTSHLADGACSFVVDHVGFVPEVSLDEVKHLSVETRGESRSDVLQLSMPFGKDTYFGSSSMTLAA